MRTLSLSYSTSTGMLSLASDTSSVQGNANDNNAITISVTGLPTTYVSAKIEYGVIIENNSSGAYYPFSELTGGTCTIPKRVCRAATSGRLPIGLKITYSNQNVECSANQLVIPLGTWRDSEETMADAFGDQIMMRGSSWEWLEAWTYSENAIVYWDGQFWMSTEDDNVGHEPDPTSIYWSGIGEKGDTGNSLSASVDGNTLTITETDHTGAVVDEDEYDLLGQIGIDAEFEDTTLAVTTTDYGGTETTVRKDLKGDSLRASFSGSVLTVEQVKNDGTVVDTESQDIKGDSLEASFDGSVLTVKQVENDGTVVDTDSANLLGDGLKASFSGSVLTVEQFKNDGTTVATDSADLLGNGLEASFSGTILTVKEKKNDGTVVATTSSNLKGDSLEADFSGPVLTITQKNAAGQTVDTDSANLLGDSLRASFSGTTLTVEQVNNAGTVVDSDSQDLKGDSLEASFSGNTLTIDQVNAAGQTVDTDTYDMLGETGISASFTGKVLNVTTKDYTGNETTVSQDVEGPQGIQGEQGPPGIGIPTGGTTGQMLVKKSATDYDTEWVNRDPVVTFYMNITVTASAGTPSLSGIAITATPTSGNTITGTTDASGKCTLSGVQQNTAYTITGAKTNFVVTSASVTVIDISTAVSLTCYELPKMTVTVLDPSSVAMSGIPVTIAGTEIYTGTTDSNGQYSAYVAVDTYTVSVTVASTQITPTAQSVSAVASGTPTVSFTVHDKPVLTVTVTGGTIAGRTVTATQTGGSVITAVTNAYGTATMILEPSLATSVSVDAQTNYFTPTAYTVTPAQDATYSHTFAYVAMPVVTVTVETATSLSVSGLAIAASLSGQSDVTGTTDANGQCTLILPAEGTWSIALTTPLDPDQYASDTASVTASGGQTYTATITITAVSTGYGYAAVDIDISTSDPSTRCTYPQTITVGGQTVDNSCYGFTPMAGSSGGIFSVGSWASHLILDGIKPVSSDGGTTPTFTDAPTDATQWTTGTEYFTEFPFNWLSITNDGTKIRIIFSDADTQPDSTFQCYAHAKACDSYENADIESAVASASRNAIMSSNNNNYFANAFHVGCFGGNVTSDNLYSKCNNTYSTSVVYANYFQYANARGGEYDCMNYQQWTYLQALFILLFKSTNSQAAHSNGLTKVDSSSVSSINTNAPLATDAYGMAGKVGVAERMAFFWIHDLWGNYYQFIGGAWNRAQSDVKLYYWLPRQANSRAFNNGWTAATTYATQANMGTDTGLTYTNSGNFIVGVAGTNTGGFAATNTSGGSASTFWCDYGNVYSDSSYAYFPNVGGYYNLSAGRVGMFYCVVGVNSTGSSSNYGSRLSFRGGR